jgi:YhgE/Pip-like protein
MNALRVLASPRVWGPVVGIVAVLALVFYAYLGAVVSPEENLEDLPIALVNEDRGGELAGKDTNLGDRVVERVTGPDSPAAGTVAWAKPDTRGEALEGIGKGEYYGAIVIPRDYTQRISGLAGPPTTPSPASSAGSRGRRASEYWTVSRSRVCPCHRGPGL